MRDDSARLVYAENDDSLVLYSNDSMSDQPNETLFAKRPFLKGYSTASHFGSMRNDLEFGCQ